MSYGLFEEGQSQQYPSSTQKLAARERFRDVGEGHDEICSFLGPLSKCMFVRSQGVVVGGETIEEALHMLRNVVNAAEVQQRAMQAAGGVDNLWIPSPDVQKRMLEARRHELEEGSADQAPDGTG